LISSQKKYRLLWSFRYILKAIKSKFKVIKAEILVCGAAEMIKEAIAKIIEGKHLSQEEAIAVMTEIMEGAATPAQIGSFITALRIKRETVEEITGFATVMRAMATPVKCKSPRIVDTCGTGGDGLHTFNISTASAFVAAGAGATVAKHGNRSVSSSCGSADVLKELGVNIEAEVPTVENCLDEVGIGFLFAPLLHKAMKHAIGPRREIGIRTVFNVLGPLTNPAGAKAQLIGVYDAGLTESLAKVLKNLGSERVFVVHGEDGEDEISITGRTKVSELRNGEINTYMVMPEDFGIPKASLKEILGGDAKENSSILRSILDGEKGARRDAVLLNAAAVITAAGITEDIKQGIKVAMDSIDSGKAKQKLDDLVKRSCF
jgi:anthranilate phosphoribosyltransferase